VTLLMRRVTGCSGLNLPVIPWQPAHEQSGPVPRRPVSLFQGRVYRTKLTDHSSLSQCRTRGGMMASCSVYLALFRVEVDPVSWAGDVSLQTRVLSRGGKSVRRHGLIADSCGPSMCPIIADGLQLAPQQTTPH
jgi:hypothetical protein